jgi:large subunit ribosomal protein L25
MEGLIPAVCYGGSAGAIHVAVAPIDVVERLSGTHGKNALFKLALSDGSEHLVRVGDYQKDPIHRGLVHVDFIVINPEKARVAEVPLELVGNPTAVKLGGRLRQLRWTVKVSACPQDVPAKLTLDIQDMELGQVRKVSTIGTPDGVKLMYKQDYAIAQIFLPRGAEETKGDEDGAESA